MFAASLSAAALIIAVGTYISAILDTDKPESEASLEERQDRIALFTLVSALWFLLLGMFGIPHETINLYPNIIGYKIYHHIVNEVVGNCLLDLSYKLLFISLIGFFILMLWVGILYKGRFPQLIYDDYTQEDFFVSFMEF
jgi:hypothetical protein